MRHSLEWKIFSLTLPFVDILREHVGFINLLSVLNFDPFKKKKKEKKMRSTKLLDVYLWCFAAVALHVLVPDVHLCGEGRSFFVMWPFLTFVGSHLQN